MLPYSPGGTQPSQPAVSSAPQLPPETPFYKRPAVIAASALGAITLAGAAFGVYYFFFRVPPPDVALQAKPPENVLVGEPFSFTVSYQNASDQTLEDASVAITVPAGVSIMGVDPSTRVSSQDLGSVGPQGIGTRTFSLIVTDGEQSVKHIAVGFRYHLGGHDGPPFERSIGTDFNVGASAVKVDFDVPDNGVFSGQNFPVTVAYQNNSQTAYGNAKLFFDYPANFSFIAPSGTPPSAGNNEWDLQTLAPADQGTVSIVGNVNGGQQSFFTLGVHLQVDIDGRTYTLESQRSQPVAISSPPLSVQIVANGKPDYVAGLGDRLTYVLSYHNGSSVALQNVVIQAAVKGQLFDLSTVASQGTLDTVNNTLTWSTANTPALANLQPGADGKVQFQVGLKSIWPITRAADKNFTLDVHAKIQSLTVPTGVSADQTIGQDDLITKVHGDTSIASLVYYKDPDPTVINKGPYPPRVNQPTQYTVHWQVRNYATDINNVHVVATLQSGARMLKVVKSTAAAIPAYDPQTGQVSWDIPSVAANQGAFGVPIEAVFQIEATPAANQAGTDMPLLGETILTATDGFTGTPVKARALAKTSALPDDTRAAGTDRRVLP